MHIANNLLLFIVTFIAGIAGLQLKMGEKKINYLLAFSGSFLLSITLLHLLPETVAESGANAGIYILAGFFLQLLIQRLTHGVEHGHIHTHTTDHHAHSHAVHFNSIFLGLGFHAFMEGLPLGFNYRQASTEPSLFLAVAAHKLPEVILLSTLAASIKSKRSAILTILIFSLLTPMGSLTASFLGRKYYAISKIVTVLIPIVAGVFIHISTTIFFESGTKHHLLTRAKTISIIGGVLLGLLTLLFE